MKKVLKWILILGGGLFILVVAALLIVPMFVDVEKYKPEIEKRVSEATGRPFSIGGQLELSLFPWAGLAFSDLHLGNPPGFKEKDFLSVKSFEARVKLLPLLSRDVQVKRFILEGPRIVLEKSRTGQGSWEGIGKPSDEVPSKPPKKGEKPPEKGPGEGLPIKAIAVGEFAITEGAVLWIDQPKGERKEISDISLRLHDVSLDRPIRFALSAKLDERPLSLEGKAGPVGKDPGKGTIPLDLVVNALKQLTISLKGKVVDPATRPQFDLALEVSSFSPRKLVAALGQAFPVTTADPEVLNLVGLKAKLRGDLEHVSVSDGVLDLDESKLSFSIKAKDFPKPDVQFDLNLDKIDLDRYLPPPAEDKSTEEKPKAEDKTTEEKTKAKGSAAKQDKIDYTPLRRLVLDGSIRVAKLKAQGATMQDLYLKVSGKNGRFSLKPLTAKLYGGDLSASGALDVAKDMPRSNIELHLKEIQAGPLLKDVLEKDFLEGGVQADVAFSMAGDEAEAIKRTLNGKGDLVFKDGAIVGIDLAGMLRNAKAAFGLGEKKAERPKTDFSELHSPFTITDGIVDTPNTSLVSPLLRVLVAGKANLVNETLDFRVEPKFVATIKGQGDTKERSGLTVPVLVTGTFSSPKFRPDLKGMLKKGLEQGIPKPSELKKILPGQGAESGGLKSLEEKGKDLLKGLPFGR
jgi:AsmA protein